MAILENGTRNYFKVDLEHSFIQNNMVFAAITVYGTEADRLNEKYRLNEFLLFDANCKRKLQELGANEHNLELYESFSKAVGYVSDKRYANDGSSIPNMTFPQEVMNLLMQCGFKSEWISQPIRIVSKWLVNCGLCGEQSLTAEYIYGKLKAKMALDIRDI